MNLIVAQRFKAYIYLLFILAWSKTNQKDQGGE